MKRSKFYVTIGQQINDWTIIEAPNKGPITGVCKCGFQKTTWAYRFFDNKMCTQCRIDRQKFGNRSIEKAKELAIRQVYSEYKGWAKVDKRQFNLQLDEKFVKLITGNCHYCNRVPYRHLNKHGFEITVTGIDRLDSSLGYTSQNVVSCCTICNMMKNTLTEDEFIEHIKLVASNRLGVTI